MSPHDGDEWVPLVPTPVGLIVIASWDVVDSLDTATRDDHDEFFADEDDEDCAAKVK